MTNTTSPARRSLDLAVEILTDALELALDGRFADIDDMRAGVDHLLEASRSLGVVSQAADANPDPVLLALLRWNDNDERFVLTNDLHSALRGNRLAARRVMDELLEVTA